ncbi:PD-(D/E)XK nuclease family protein [Amaricoccus sp.]|uniref:PD-(D/E)XK nuclease family protein n=1 Tax=Amaricoccus sp. TaxID=1872485 RepID=UPI001B75C523|nr:PD-(D/E)XK nuclease family protein [Amaricoccus sp.]MBP7001395.1 PD-(D/E)XK nuclease family protein [Amaricoccus sp.]
MRLFSPSDGPRVFGLPPGADVCRALVAGIDARLGEAPPEALARVEIWTNTRRARRALMAAYAGGPARLLPRIRVVAELANDPGAPAGLPGAASALARRLDLARLVRALLAAEPGLAPASAAFDLADGLADLVDEMEGEGVPVAALRGLDAGDHALHWQRSLGFLAILDDYVAADPAAEAQGRMRAAADALAARWAEDPPRHPVIVAGSTGSRGPTRAFMAAVARLPQGALVLPGFDATTPASVWARLGAGDAGAADHPQAGFRRLADALGFAPGDVAPWDAAPPPAPARNRLVALALRPAPVTGQWREEGTALVPELGAALAGVDWIEAPDPRAEARTLALLLRGAAEQGERAALVTPDRALARRVGAELGRWGLRPDDSAGRPLALTPPGVLLRQLAALAGAPPTPAALLALLTHPLTASGAGDRATHRRLTARLELKALRGGAPVVDWAALADWAAEAGPEAAEWIGWVEAALAPVTQDGGGTTLAERTARLRAAAEALAAGPGGLAAGRGDGGTAADGATGARTGDARGAGPEGGSPALRDGAAGPDGAAAPRPDGTPKPGGGAQALWDKAAGIEARAMLDGLAAAAGGFGPIGAEDFRALLATLANGRDVPEEAVVTHPGVAIWGTLEARVQSADLTLLAGLNEGVWPRLPGADAWLSRPMRRALGLPSPERVVGLAAHDFQQAAAAGRVVLSRSARDAEGPTVPSRWLLRLENLLGGLGPEGAGALAAAKARGAAAVAMAALLDRPEAAVAPAGRPCPRPPAAARPASLSVTDLDQLVRDPYAVYARRVLRLRPLDPLGRAPDALERGSAIHGALEAFLAATEAGLPEDPRPAWDAACAAALAAAAPWPAVRAAWAARLGRAADWFLAGEAERRARAAPLAREIRGARALEGTPLPCAVVAKADRIDRDDSGGYAIYDYKSGGLPGGAEAAYHLQLHIEAAIAAAGGFPDLPPGPAAHLELLGLGSRRAREIAADPEAFWPRLAALVGRHQDEASGFVARLRPGLIGFPGDYDHLARRGEWADGDDPAVEDVG